MKIHAQMLKVQAEVDSISKDRTNTQGKGYSFRGIDDVYNTIHEILAKHGVYSVPTVLKREREERKSNAGGTLLYSILDVKYTFYADDGSSVEAITVGEAMDSGDKSCNKAMSAAHKYCLLQTFCIPTADDKDTENQTHEVAPKQKAQIKPVAKPIGGQTTGAIGIVTDKQRKAIWARLMALGFNEQEAREIMTTETGKDSSKDWTREDVDKLFKKTDALANNNPQPVAQDANKGMGEDDSWVDWGNK